jgi:hypothetical protein
MKNVTLRALTLYAVVSSALFLAQTFRPHGFPFTALPAVWFDLVGFVGMLAPLLYGFFTAAIVVRRLERENRARPAWMLLAGWLGSFAAGEAVLGAYRYLALVKPPTPSAGDVFFLLGYAMLLCGAAWFVRVYATSGFPLGSAREAWLVTIGATAVVTVVGACALTPMVHAAEPTAGAIVALAYPVLDFLALIPTALLLAMTIRFRGGRVWAVWAFILSGFVVFSVADVLFAYLYVARVAWVDPLLSATFIVGNTLIAAGMAEQRRLVEQ